MRFGAPLLPFFQSHHLGPSRARVIIELSVCRTVTKWNVGIKSTQNEKMRNVNGFLTAVRHGWTGILLLYSHIRALRRVVSCVCSINTFCCRSIRQLIWINGKLQQGPSTYYLWAKQLAVWRMCDVDILCPSRDNRMSATLDKSQQSKSFSRRINAQCGVCMLYVQCTLYSIGDAIILFAQTQQVTRSRWKIKTKRKLLMRRNQYGRTWTPIIIILTAKRQRISRSIFPSKHHRRHHTPSTASHQFHAWDFGLSRVRPSIYRKV